MMPTDLSRPRRPRPRRAAPAADPPPRRRVGAARIRARRAGPPRAARRARIRPADRARLAAIAAIAAIGLVALGCGAPRIDAPAPRAAIAAPPRPAAVPAPDPDLHPPPPRRWLAIDWASTPLATEADAHALWQRIAPTGEDWELKLLEVPAAAARPLALALLSAGQLTCMAPPTDACSAAPLTVERPRPSAGLSDPCLRRLLALWALGQLEPADAVPARAGAPAATGAAVPALRAIAAIPPPESELVAAALRAVPEDEQALLLELMVVAARAGQREVVDAMLGRLDEPQLIAAAAHHHLPSALEILSPQGHRAVYLGAIAAEAMPPAARVRAIAELAAEGGALQPDLRAALTAAERARDCTVAAAAGRALARTGVAGRLPTRPRTRSPAAMTRALCVLAGYEATRDADEPSLVPTYLPARGLEREITTYDALAEVDGDGDGDPRTERAIDLVPRAEAELPEPSAVVRALQSCTGAVCASAEHVVRLSFRPSPRGELLLHRIGIAERPPCAAGPAQTRAP